MKPSLDLATLTGLSELQLADTLLCNPRAYMALKGAVAEKHLDLHLSKLMRSGEISSYRKGSGDFEKDFYVRLSPRGRELSVECKNVEVIKVTSRHHWVDYLSFLSEFSWLPKNSIPSRDQLLRLSPSQIRELVDKLPVELRESGLARYAFGTARCNVGQTILDDVEVANFLSNFNEHPMTIDFQRTRNSRDEGADGDAKSFRFYGSDEIDILAGCLFSRTLKWDFLFCASSKLERHHTYRDRLSNKVILNRNWKKEFRQAASDVRAA